MAEEQQQGNLLDATEGLIEWVAAMVGTYGLSEATVMDLFRIQLMYIEQQANAVPSGQALVDMVGEEVEREADEVIGGE